jgi:predicted ATPase
VPASRSFVSIPVDRLTTAESQELAAALLDVRAPSTKEMAAVIAAEAGGSPFFIDELVRSAESSGARASEPARPRRRGDTDAREASLAHMIQLRLSRLPAEAQRLLALVAVNGRPLPENVLKSAAYVVEPEPILALLRSEHLVRARDTDHGIELEAYHDRIRETVVGSLDQEQLRDAHHRLATAFEAQKGADAELLAEHLFAAGQATRAFHYTMLAAKVRSARPGIE